MDLTQRVTRTGGTRGVYLEEARGLLGGGIRTRVLLPKESKHEWILVMDLDSGDGLHMTCVTYCTYVISSVTCHVGNSVYDVPNENVKDTCGWSVTEACVVSKKTSQPAFFSMSKSRDIALRVPMHAFSDSPCTPDPNLRWRFGVSVVLLMGPTGRVTDM